MTSKAELTRLIGGKPKKVTRGTAKRILVLAEAIRKDGICSFPYYSKDAPEDYDAYRGSDTRKMLERELNSGFWYTTGNWEHLNEGHDTMICFFDEAIGDTLAEAGFRIRRHDSTAGETDDDDDEGDNE